MKPFERKCRCGWLHRAVRSFGLLERHTHRCEVAHAIGFNAYVAEQRAALQAGHGTRRCIPVIADPQDAMNRRN